MNGYTGHIPESFIDELLSRVDIVEVIKPHVALKRRGANYLGKCPFHTEKTPSFTVSPTKQFYHCFGCGANGNSLRFLTEYEGLHFVEACEALADRVGLQLPNDPNQKEKVPRHNELFKLLEEANLFFQKHLRASGTEKKTDNTSSNQFNKSDNTSGKKSDNHTSDNKAANKAVQYLKSRGITGSTAKFFAVGYAPQSWDALLHSLGQKGKRIPELFTAGLVVCKEENKDRYFDRFRDRIMFPIRDRRGRVLGFGGRVIDQGTPKYLNSPETPVFHKGQEVYGLYEARLKNRHLTTLIVVEGYMDVLSLSQAGIEQVVATLGTALTDKHLDLLFRQVFELIFCFDGDAAGRTAADRALKSCLPHMKEGRRVKFVFLPNNEDPDSVIRRQGKPAFLAYLEKATSLTDYLFDSVSRTLDLTHIDGRAALVSRARPLIARLPEGILKQMMFEKLTELSGASQMGVSGGAGSQIISQRGSSQNSRYQNSKNPRDVLSYQHKRAAQTPPTSPALRALAMLLENRNLLSLISKPYGFEMADTPGTALLCVIIDILQKEPAITVEQLQGRLSEQWTDIFESIDLKLIANFVPKEGQEAEFLGAIERLQERATEQLLESLIAKAKINALTSQEKTQLRHLIEQKAKNPID